MESETLSLTLVDNLIITVCQLSLELFHARNPVWGGRNEADEKELSLSRPDV